jgi:hypothetical protein
MDLYWLGVVKMKEKQLVVHVLIVSETLRSLTFVKTIWNYLIDDETDLVRSYNPINKIAWTTKQSG